MRHFNRDWEEDDTPTQAEWEEYNSRGKQIEEKDEMIEALKQECNRHVAVIMDLVAQNKDLRQRIKDQRFPDLPDYTLPPLAPGMTET